MITSDDITQAFTGSGFDTPEKLAALINELALQSQLKQIDLQLEAINAKRIEAVTPIENERIDLQNKRAELVAQLTGK